MTRDDARETAAESVVDAEAVKIWCVCDSVKGDVESYHPSYAWAMERIDREMDARPITVQAMVREAEASFSGRGFRVVWIAWERYREILAVAAESHDFALREGLLHHAALGTGRSRRLARTEMKQLKAGVEPKRKLPAHALDLPELVAIAVDDYGRGPILTREAALEQAAEENARALAQGAAWDGRWCLVVELGDPLPGTWIAPEFAGPLGVESLITRRAVRLVRPTPAERAQFARAPAVA
jgi:hypothetical protein